MRQWSNETMYNASMKLNALQLRELEERKATGVIRNIERNPIYFILENIYDTYNIGGLFRLADALAIEKMFICGETEIPPNHRIKKASIGTYKVVPWEYKRSAYEAIADLNLKFKIKNSKFSEGKNNNITIEQSDHSPQKSRAESINKLNIIAVEQNDKSIPYIKADYTLPVALIFGNESYGITGETLKLADQIVEIPMWGINKSLNVIVSAAIVSYWCISKTKLG